MKDPPEDTGGLASAANAPLLLEVPVTADDVARVKRRRIRTWGLALGGIALMGGWLYKRSVDPLNAQAAYDFGVRSFQATRYPAAILSFDRAIALKPDFVQAYLMRGKVCSANGQPDCAISDFTRVVKLQPNSTEGLIERGEVYLQLKKFQLAAADGTQAIEIDPKRGAAYNLRGMALSSMGNPSRALEDFNRAIMLAPNEDDYFQRGATYQELGQHQLAIADFDQAIEFLPSPVAYFARAESRRAVGDIEGAEADRQEGRILDGRAVVSLPAPRLPPH